ncbi:hypothetical protein GIS00_15820 [Nakamurella sp. YIM 132087]|uniref:DNA-directed RNA polymerase subunit beta n=1 Tax=Nakamurella alba TaxID=2665158 RepID=A0A7K1FMP8_9ACTN|nr:hypothetical protein [Nakamurella alba]
MAPHVVARLAGAQDESARWEAAHRTARAVLARGRQHSADEDEIARLVRLVETEGLDDVAALWAGCEAETLPGALWRLYLLREWIRREPRRLAGWFAIGSVRGGADEAVAGVADPPGPQEVADVADAVLTGAVTADLDVALDRAAAFCAVVATGSLADPDPGADPAERSGQLRRTSGELSRAARRARAGELG